MRPQSEAGPFYGRLRRLNAHQKLLAYILAESADPMTVEELAAAAGLCRSSVDLAILALPSVFPRVRRGRRLLVELHVERRVEHPVLQEVSRGARDALGGAHALAANDLRPNFLNGTKLANSCSVVSSFSEENKTTTNNRARARISELDAAQLEQQFAGLLEQVDLPAPRFAGLVACSIVCGKHAGRYLARLLENPAVELSQEQRRRSGAKAKELLASVSPAVEAGPVPEVALCPGCGSSQLVQRPASRVQCMECVQLFEGVLKHGQESERGKASRKEKAGSGV